MIPPVLFPIFNRPRTTAMVFEAIRQARPARLYVAADGPRADRTGEAERCEAARKIATAVDWPCEVELLFREKNLGAGKAVSQAISWFFEHEEDGIILEDDCVPDPSFFPFCREVLDRYRDDDRVMSISGTCTVPNYPSDRYSYHFSKYGGVWGWATWRRAWRKFDYAMTGYPEFVASGGLDKLSDGAPGFSAIWRRNFDSAFAVQSDIWDYQWVFAMWYRSGLSCMPWVNLVKNIGFGDGATHTQDVNSPFFNIPYGKLVLPLVHPEIVCRNVEVDKYKDKLLYGMGNGSNSRSCNLARSLTNIPVAVRNWGRKLLNHRA